MKKFFSYIFTFIAVFLITAAATISLSVAGNTYVDSNQSAEGQGSSLSFLTDILNSLNNGKNINLDADLLVEYDDTVYGLEITGAIDIKNQNDIKADIDMKFSIDGNTKNILINYYNNNAFIVVDNIKLKLDTQTFLTMFGGLLSNGNIEEDLDLAVLLEHIDLNGIMNALGKMSPEIIDGDTHYPLKEDGVIDAEIVMNSSNELKQLSVEQFEIFGANLKLFAELEFNHNPVQTLEDEDNYLDIVSVYNEILKLPEIDNKSINLNGLFSMNGSVVNADIDFDFSRENNYYAVDLLIPELVNENIKLNYLNNNLYFNVNNINLMFDNSLISMILGLINQNVNLGTINTNDLISQLFGTTDDLQFNFTNNTIFELLNGIKIDNNQIYIELDLHKILGTLANGYVKIVFENNKIKLLDVNVLYKLNRYDFTIEISELENISTIDEFDNYLNVRETVENHINLFNITDGNLVFNANVIDKTQENVFDFDAEVNADIKENYYSFDSDFSGFINGDFNIYYENESAYINYNDVKLFTNKTQLEDLFNKYLKQIIDSNEKDLNNEVKNLTDSVRYIISSISFESVVGMLNYLDCITINKDLISIDINEVIDETNVVVDVLLENQEFKQFKITNINIDNYVLNVDTTFNKNSFTKTEINEDEYLNVLDLINKTIQLKDIKYGTIDAFVSVLKDNNLSEFDALLEFNIENLNDLYINFDVETSGKLNLDANISILENEFYINLFNSYINGEFETIYSIIDLLNINSKNVSVPTISLPEFNKDIDVVKILKSIKNIVVNSSTVNIVLDGKLFNSLQDLNISVLLNDNNIEQININNLFIDNTYISLELIIDRDKPVEFVENKESYLDIESLIFDIDNKLKLFGIDSSLIFGLIPVNTNQQIDINNIKAVQLTQINNILDYLSSVTINNSLISINLLSSMLGLPEDIRLDINLKDSTIDYIKVKSNSIDLEFAFDNNYEDKLNIYDLYQNILNLQNLRYGNILLDANYKNNTEEYNIQLDADFDVSDINDIYLNLEALISGSIDIDANVSIYNNNLYARLFNIFVKIGCDTIFDLLSTQPQTFGTKEVLSPQVDVSYLEIIKNIKALNINSEFIQFEVSLMPFGIDSIVNLKIFLNNNDVYKIKLEKLIINEHTFDFEITLDKSQPIEKVENIDKYLCVETLLDDVENIFTILNNQTEIKTVSQTDSNENNIISTLEKVLGFKVNTTNVINYLKTVEVNSNKIKLDLDASVIEKDGKLSIDVSLDESKVDTITVKNNEEISLDLAFNDKHNDKFNIYKLYQNIIDLQELRFGNINAEGLFILNGQSYNFDFAVDFDFSNFNNVYLNSSLKTVGALDLDLNFALQNNNLFVRLFDIFVGIDKEYIIDTLTNYGININDLVVDTDSLMNQLPVKSINIQDILDSVLTFNVSKESINLILDGSLFNLDSKIDLTIKLNNNDITGIIIRNFKHKDFELSIDLDLDKSMPEKIIENTSNYLKVPELISDVENTLLQFGINLSSSIENASDNIEDINLTKVIKDILEINLNEKEIVNYLKTVQINSSKINFNIKASLIERLGQLNIDIGLNNNKLDYVNILNGNDLNLSFAFNNNHEDKVNIYTLYKNILAFENLRSGNILIDGSYKNSNELYEFVLDADIDLTNLNNIYLNTDLDLSGAFDVDLNFVLSNNKLFARLFDIYLFALGEDINKFINDLDLNNIDIETQINNKVNSFDFSDISIQDIFKAIKEINFNSNNIALKFDSNIFGINSLIELNVKILNNDIVGLKIIDLTIGEHVINIDLTLEKSMKKSNINNESDYLDVFEFVDDVQNVIETFIGTFNNSQIKTINQTNNSLDLENISSLIQNILGFEFTPQNVVNYLKTISVNSSEIKLDVNASLLEREGLLTLNVSLDDSKIDSVKVTDNNDLSIDLAFNDNHQDKFNIYTLIDNILNLQYLRFGNISLNGNYLHNNETYNFDVNASLDLSNLENIFANLVANITGNIDVDLALTLLNNDLFVKLYDNNVTVNIEEIKSMIEGVSFDSNLDITTIINKINVNELSIDSIIASILSINTTNKKLDLVLDGSIIGLNSVIDLTIKLDNNDVVGLIIRDLNIDGHVISIDLDLDKSMPIKNIDNPSNYLDVLTLVEDIENVVSNFGLDLSTININNNVNIEEVAVETLGFDLTIFDISDYLKTTKINSSNIELSIQGSILNRENKIDIKLGLDKCKLDYVSINDSSDLDIKLAFNDKHNDKINIYTLYDNILNIPNIRYGNVDANGLLKLSDEVYNFNVNADIDATNFDNLYINALANISGALNIDANIALFNNDIFVRLFENYLNISIEEIKQICNAFGFDMESIEIPTNDLSNMFDITNLNVSTITNSIEKLILNKNSIIVVVDATNFGLNTKLNVTIKLENNDIVGLIIEEFKFENNELSIDIDLDKSKPVQEVEKQEEYLDVLTLLKDVKDVVSNFGIVLPDSINVSSVETVDFGTICEDVLSVDGTVEGIANYLGTTQINSNIININLNAELIEREDNLGLVVGLDNSKLDYVTIVNGEDLNISFAFNDNHDDKINIFTLYDNILSIPDIRFGSIGAQGQINNNSYIYNFDINADIDMSNTDNIYVNALANISGALEIDTSISLFNNELFISLFNNYININVEDISKLLEAFGVNLDEFNLSTEDLTSVFDYDDLNVNSILQAIEKVIINKDSINIIVDASFFGLETKLDFSIKLNNDDISGLAIREFKFDENELSVDIDINKEKPVQSVESQNSYLDIMTILKDVKDIASNFGIELPETLELPNETTLDMTVVTEDVLGIDNNIESFVNYLKTTQINSNVILLELNAGLIERINSIEIVVGLVDSELDYVTIVNGEDLNISFAFNDKHNDKINVYTLYDNIIKLQDLRYSNVVASGEYQYNSDIYNFALDGAFDLSNMDDIYVNANAVVNGSLEADLSFAIFNNSYFARLFDLYLNIDNEDLNEILESFGFNTTSIEFDSTSFTKEINLDNLTIANILNSIEKIIITNTSVDIIIDANIIGLNTKFDLTIKLENNDVVGLTVRDLNVDEHKLSIDINVDKQQPNRNVENTQKYLNVNTFIESVKEIVSEFGIEIPDTISIEDTDNVNIEQLLKELLDIDLNLTSISNYLKNVEFNSSIVSLNVNSLIIDRNGKLFITIALYESQIDYINIKDENGIDISLAFNNNHDNMINAIKFYNNICSLIDLREATLDAEASIYNNNETIMGLNVEASLNVGEGNNYLSAFVRYVSGDTDLSANVNHINQTFYIDYTDAKLKLTNESLLKLLSLNIDNKENKDVTLIDLINYIIDNVIPENNEPVNIEVEKIIEIIAGINIANISNNIIEINISGNVIGQDKQLKLTLVLSDNDISHIELSGLKIDEDNYIDLKANFTRTSEIPEVKDEEYFDAYTAYTSILELFDNEDVSLYANGTVYNYDEVNYNTEFKFNVDARKNVVNNKIGAYVLANILGADYGSRNHKFQLNFIDDELYINYNELKGHLAKTAITNTVLSVIDLLGIERAGIESLLGSVEDLFEGVGLAEIFKDISGIDVKSNIEINLDETIFDILNGLTIKTNGSTLGVVIDGSVIGIDGNIDFSLTTIDGKINTIDFNKLGLGGKFVDVSINVSPKVEEMPTLTSDEASSYWNFSSLEELSNMLYNSVNGIETFKLTGNVTLSLGSIEAADVPTTLYVNRDANDKITVYGKLEIPTGSAAFKEYKGAYHIDARTTYIYFDGEYLYIHRIDKVRTSILAWNKNTKDHHFYGKIKFDYFNNDLYSTLDFILGFSNAISMFKNEFNKGGSTNTPPYVENIFKGYQYTADSTNNKFDVTISGDALIQNDKIGDIKLRIGKNNSTGLIAGIYAQMKVVSIINIIANFSLERIADSSEFNNAYNSNISPSSSNYKTNELVWGF